MTITETLKAKYNFMKNFDESEIDPMIIMTQFICHNSNDISWNLRYKLEELVKCIEDYEEALNKKTFRVPYRK
jgi:hypothetical protein